MSVWRPTKTDGGEGGGGRAWDAAWLGGGDVYLKGHRQGEHAAASAQKLMWQVPEPSRRAHAVPPTVDWVPRGFEEVIPDNGRHLQRQAVGGARAEPRKRQFVPHRSQELPCCLGRVFSGPSDGSVVFFCRSYRCCRKRCSCRRRRLACRGRFEFRRGTLCGVTTIPRGRGRGTAREL